MDFWLSITQGLLYGRGRYLNIGAPPLIIFLDIE
jgi:hypothetical protein